MSTRRLTPVSVFITAIALLTALFGSASAQNTDATPAGDDALVTHPAHIHSGTCDTLGDVVYPLNNIVTPEFPEVTQATPSAILASTPVIAAGQSTTVDVSLDDLLAAEHAINVHQSPEAIDVYIACGDITGTVTNGVLIVDLMELDGSGYMGQASLLDNGDGTTTVYMDLIRSGGMTGTPEASPAS